jgi:heme-degrading monooxygenase HmoA
VRSLIGRIGGLPERVLCHPVPMPGTVFADTPEPPYVAVIFTSTRTDGDHGYAATAEAMETLAADQPGFLGMESARDAVGITVSYWSDQEAARAWKQVAAHLVAQRRGREGWYADYRVRVATVERDYSLDSSALDTEC